jgi:Bifunctional DNA primase/polymerase, N-terminal
MTGPRFAIFPCRGKVPLTEHGCKDATTDLEQIRAWEEQFPGCNWSVATGTPSENIAVVDVDGIWEEPGDAWTQIANDCGGLPRTVTVLSGSGHSMHWWFLLPDGVKLGNTAGKLAPGIDTRAEGGYVVIPPSIHPETGNPYTWVQSPRDVPIAPIPVKLLDLLLPKPRRLSPARIRLAERSDQVALRILDEECNRVAAATPGMRNMTAFSASAAIGNLVAGGDIVLSVAAEMLLEAALVSGLPHREAETVVANGLEVGMTTPRTYRTREAS